MNLFWVTFIQNIRYLKRIDVEYKPREMHKVEMQYFNKYKMGHRLTQDLMAMDGV